MDVMLCGTTCRRRRDACASGPHHVSRPARRCPRRHGGDPSEPVAVGRYYDPQTGQFLCVDPQVQQTEQAYVYVGDDPVGATDPLGTYTVSATGGAGYSQCGSPATEPYNIYEICEAENEAGLVGNTSGRDRRFGYFLAALGILAGAAAVISGIGVVAGIGMVGFTAEQVATISTVASITAGLTDAPRCARGTGNEKLVACVGLLSGGLGGVAGVGAPAIGLAEDYVRGFALFNIETGGATIVFHAFVAAAGHRVMVGRGTRRR